MANEVGLSLPRPEEVTLRNFSLYDHAPEVSAQFGPGVFCLAGANGLGKSTFLSAVGFAITGIVADPSREFASADEYLKYCRTYSARAFEGRISGRDRDAAEIELTMVVGPNRYRLTRNMFDPTGLRSLEIAPAEEPLSPEPDDSDLRSDAERQLAYEEAVVRDVGVKTFSQLAMLHHFVLTFDERRHLLFWDDKVSQAALFLTFGLDPDEAKHADDLRRQAERADSRARNQQYAATTARKSMEELAEQFEALGDDDQDSAEKLEQLHDERDELDAQTQRLRNDYHDADLRRTEVGANLRTARSDYEAEFESALFGRQDPATHPSVRSLLASSQCPMCGSSHQAVTDHATESLDQGCCPLCLDDLAKGSDGATDALVELDGRITELDAELKEADGEVKRLLGELENSQDLLAEQNRSIAEFLDKNESVLFSRAEGEEGSIQRILRKYEIEIADRMKMKDDERKKRDRYRRELRALQDTLAQRYRETEAEFVPMFRDLAREFLGLDLDIDFEFGTDVVRLVLTVDGSARRADDALSESQKFFVDIALRMAIARQLQAPGSQPVLYIDTPEGSLDIAYERRAGSMFAKFVEPGAHIVMTANINTSELLLRLAESCGSSLMLLQRMTDWATLSDVQVAEQDAFDRAFLAIEAKLGASQ